MAKEYRFAQCRFICNCCHAKTAVTPQSNGIADIFLHSPKTTETLYHNLPILPKEFQQNMPAHAHLPTLVMTHKLLSPTVPKPNRHYQHTKRTAGLDLVNIIFRTVAYMMQMQWQRKF